MSEVDHMLTGETTAVVTPEFNWSFSKALSYTRHTGSCIARKGWNGKKMWVRVVPGKVLTEALQGYAKGWHDAGVKDQLMDSLMAQLADSTILPTLMMHTADGKKVLGWLASQTDMLSDDWGPVTPEEVSR